MVSWKLREEWVAKKHKEALGVIEMFIILILMIVSQTYTYVQTDQFTQFLNVQFTVLQIYFNKSCMKKVLILF